VEATGLDQAIRALTEAGSRRPVIGALLESAAGLLLQRDAAAKKTGKRKKKKMTALRLGSRPECSHLVSGSMKSRWLETRAGVR
jgi:hypothetical protein